MVSMGPHWPARTTRSVSHDQVRRIHRRRRASPWLEILGWTLKYAPDVPDALRLGERHRAGELRVKETERLQELRSDGRADIPHHALRQPGRHLGGGSPVV